MDGEYKRMSREDMRKALDADNMDNKKSLALVCNLVSANVSRLIEELTEHTVIYELLPINPGATEQDKALLPLFLAKRDAIFDFATTMLSTAAVLESTLTAIAISGTDQYLFVNRFLDHFEKSMDSESNQQAKLALIAILAANTAEFAEKVRNGQTT